MDETCGEPVESIDEDEARRRRWLGNRIKARRKALGIEELELADAAKLSRSYVNRIQNGSSRGSIAAIERIAHALDCTVDYLLGDDDQPNAACVHCRRADEPIQIDDRFTLNITGDSLTVQAGEGGMFIIRFRGEMLMVRSTPHVNQNGVRA